MKGAFDKLAEIRPALAAGPAPALKEDEFLQARDLVPVQRQAAEHRLQAVLSELAEITRQNQWQQAIDLFYPVETHLPELTDHGLDAAVRERLAFALGQLGRFDDAMDQLTLCLAQTPRRFQLHSALAYTAYNALFAARNREIFLSGESRRQRIRLAHKHFEKAQQLRPEGVTNYYRQGMLLRQIEDKPGQALPLFLKAVENWEALDAQARQERSQEHKNYVKSLYQQAAIVLAKGDPETAAGLLKRCMAEDEGRDHVSRLHKYFALGKVEYQRNRLEQARDALLFAEKCGNRQPVDFVYELLARVYLALESPDKALAVIQRLPAERRRPYYRWTEADVLCALGRYDAAKSALAAANARDRRSQHKGLIRLSKIDYLLGDYRQAMTHAANADRFFRQMWTHVFDDGLFWLALSAFRAGCRDEAVNAARQLRDYRPDYPRLNKLLALTGMQGEADET